MAGKWVVTIPSINLARIILHRIDKTVTERDDVRISMVVSNRPLPIRISLFKKRLYSLAYVGRSP